MRFRSRFGILNEQPADFALHIRVAEPILPFIAHPSKIDALYSRESGFAWHNPDAEVSRLR
jgi:hypothetical protein